MIKIILAYLAIGMLLVINYNWDNIIRYREEENFTIPILILTVIMSCFIAPICLIIGIFLGLIELLKNN